MFPVFWGWIRWLYKHHAAYRLHLLFDSSDLPSLYIESLQNKRILDCRYLLCPSCSMHCNMYVAKRQTLELKTAEDEIVFQHEFHNHVNRETGKVEFSYHDMIQNMPKSLEDFRKWWNHYKDDAWMSTLTFVSPVFKVLPDGKREPRDRTPDEVQKDADTFKVYFKAWLLMCPALSREQAETLSRDFATQPATWVTSEQVQKTVLDYFNKISKIMDPVAAEQTMEERTKDFLNRFNETDMVELSRAHQIRLEDAKKIKELQKLLAAQTQNEEVSPLIGTGFSVWFWIAIISLVINVALVAYFIWIRKGIHHVRNNAFPVTT